MWIAIASYDLEAAICRRWSLRIGRRFAGQVARIFERKTNRS
jgi:hypothetical protein